MMVVKSFFVFLRLLILLAFGWGWSVPRIRTVGSAPAIFQPLGSTEGC